MGKTRWAAVVSLTLALGLTWGTAPLVADTGSAEAATRASRTLRIAASDQVSLRATLSGAGSIRKRPTVVEFTPYGEGGASYTPPAAYNQLLVEIRGTGDSDGSFDALGPRSQKDVVEVLRWACRQPWSNGRLAVAGFSASAIIVYNSLHQKLPCVKALMLKSGTFELYRDLLVPGGISNLVPGAGVVGLIGVPTAAQLPDRTSRNPLSVPEAYGGLLKSGVEGGFVHTDLDSWWRQRGFRGDVNELPSLMINGFFDVESRGAFQGFQRLRGSGAMLRMVGGHDGVPQGSDGGQEITRLWFDRHVRGIRNGVLQQPKVALMLSRGDRLDYLEGDHTTRNGRDWPLPGTAWTPLHLQGQRLSLRRGPAATAAYPVLTSVPTQSDPANMSLVGASGANQLEGMVPHLTDMRLSEATGLTFTTGALRRDVTAVGPLNLQVRLATTTPGTAIWAVLSDVAPDGSSHPLTVGRLNTDFPGVVRSKSLVRDNRTVQPYGDYTNPVPATPGRARPYQVEFWPVGNVFEKGHRIRLTLLSQSLASKPAPPALHTVELGSAQLLFPTAPGSDLATALP